MPRSCKASLIDSENQSSFGLPLLFAWKFWVSLNHIQKRLAELSTYLVQGLLPLLDL